MANPKFCDVLDTLTRPYKARMDGSASDIREAAALADLYIRVIYTLVIAESRHGQAAALRTIAAPGVGTMLAVVRGRLQYTQPTWNQSAILSIASDALFNVDAFRVPSVVTSFKALRDRLSHGHALPSDETTALAVAEALSELCSKMHDAIDAKLGHCLLESEDGNLQLVCGDGNPLYLTPLWTADGSAIGVYSHYGSDGIYYLVPGGDVVAIRNGAAVVNFENEFLPERRDNVPDLGRLVRDVVRDVGAFTEDYALPSYYFGDDADAGLLFIPWIRSTSDANQSRVDAFRVGPDNQRQWRPEPSAAWQPYSQFLREVANWQFLARRIGIGLDKFARERGDEEASRLGAQKNLQIRGPALLREVSDDLQESKSTAEFELKQRVDDACHALKPSTTVFFVVGQAGLGKTEMMLSVARERARLIENASHEPVPLYLFVSSTGRTLASLDDAVNSSLNITKLLSSQSAKALCRNGLLVLLVDGFDELLGSSGYENALGSLEPWFRELGGRGVLVASARSSYYLTQYRRSLNETTGINVDHVLAQLQPWSPQEARTYLSKRGVADPLLDSLTRNDWHLLGVPFFSKAFAAWNEANKGTAPSIFEIVVDQYLRRESAKLVDPHQGALLSHDELKALFAEIAEMMHQSKMRELEHADLVTCAQQVIGADSLEGARPGLSRRLSSLCGLGVDATSMQARFSFSHEVMFDCFLSLALQRSVSKTMDPTSVRGILGKGRIQASVFDWLVQHEPVGADRMLQEVGPTIPDPKAQAVLSQNLGLLWTSLLKRNAGIPPTSQVRGLRIDNIELAETGWNSLRLENCYIERLEIPTLGCGVIHVPGSEIGLLQCGDSIRLARSVKDVNAKNIKAVHVEEGYADTPTGVRSLLEELGLVVPAENTDDLQRVEAAQFFLDKLTSRLDVQVVARRDDGLPDDPRLNWTLRLGDEAWRNFVDALLRNELAVWEPITAGGKPKSRLVFETPPAAIASHDYSNERIRTFWSGR